MCIRDRDKLERGLEPAPGDGAPSRPQVPAGGADPDLPTASDLSRRSNLRLTGVELRDAADLDQPTFEALSTYGLLRPDSSGYYGDAALGVCLLYTSPSPRDRTRSRMPS